ncbi:MAG: histidine phosphatase family protein [Vicinamibacterales bacterium]
MRSIRLLLAGVVLLQLSGAAIAAEPQQIFIVRHAEKSAAPAPPASGAAMTAPGDDPPLSTTGRARAERLAVMLRSAGIRHVFSTEFLRTRQTAAPTAQALHLDPVAIPAKDADGLLSQLAQAQGNALVVGHSNSVAALLQRLGIKEDISIAESEYDNLFIVTRGAAGGSTLARLRY